jgi:hypothetical protein
MAGEGRKIAGQAARSGIGYALPWLIVLGVGWFVWSKFKDDIDAAGGLTGWIQQLLGIGKKSDIGEEQPGDQGGLGNLNGSGDVTGKIALTDGASATLVGDWTAGDATLEIPIDLNNDAPNARTVGVRLDVFGDYWLSDESYTWEQQISIAPRGSKHLVANVAVSRPGTVLRQPQFFLDLSIAGEHVHRVEHVQAG